MTSRAITNVWTGMMTFEAAKTGMLLISFNNAINQKTSIRVRCKAEVMAASVCDYIVGHSSCAQITAFFPVSKGDTIYIEEACSTSALTESAMCLWNTCYF